MKYLILSKKQWNKKNYNSLNKSFKFFSSIKINEIKKISPEIIFFIHWSKKIPSKIFNNYLCIQFHSSNLPKFKGGSPIQNQIINNKRKTKITAFKVNETIDAGDFCLKKNLDLKGSANEIYIRMEKTCINMIKKLTKKKRINFFKQKGKSTFYKRRKIEESNISSLKSINIKKIYNFIRMLDAPGYPNAFLEFKNFKIEIYDAKLKNKYLNAKIKILKKK
tara:strand:+ start:1639 stop:2301 length:663 start_codon:yes stop_codon:yes gene_type:complete